MIEDEIARLVGAGAPLEIAREVAAMRASADGPVACTEKYDERGHLIELAGWRWDEFGQILADPYSEVEMALRRWGSANT